MEQEVSVFLSAGGNIGDSRMVLQQSLVLISELNGTKVAQCSPFYRTKAWGRTDQPDFLNIAVEIQTCLPAAELMESLIAIEKKLGRIREEHWGPRIIDIDILFYGDEKFDLPALKVPHPELQNRMFVLKPLMSIAPNFIHPVLNKTISELYRECNDGSPVIEEGLFF